MSPILSDLLQNVQYAERVLIFVDDKNKVSALHWWFTVRLQKHGQRAVPYYSDELEDQLVVKLDGDDPDIVREDTLGSLTQAGGTARVGIMTTTGSTGIDYPRDWRRVVVYLESDLANLVQKWGRVDRTDDPVPRFTAELYWNKVMFRKDRYFHPELRVFCYGVDGKGIPLRCRRRYLLNCLTNQSYVWSDLFIEGHCCDLCDARRITVE